VARRVLILRPADKACSIARMLSDRGDVPVFLPLTEIVPLEHTLPSEIGGFVLTSPSAAAALPSACSDRPVYAVGAGSARAARARGFHRVEAAGGDAAALIDALARREDVPAPLVWLSGADVSRDVAAALRKAGKPAQRVVVYANRPAEPDPGTVAAALDPAPDAVLIQSAKAAGLLGALLARLDRRLPATALVSLSPRIDASLEATDLVHRAGSRCVATTPDDIGLLAELDRLGHNRAG